jgi:hypothetical protein
MIGSTKETSAASAPIFDEAFDDTLAEELRLDQWTFWEQYEGT